VYTMKYAMKRACLLVLAAIVCLPVGAVFAQSYPDKVVRLIVPLTPGGGADTLARLVAESLTRQLGGSFIVENRAGGGTVIGTQAVVRALPDGAMLLMAQSSLAMSTALNEKLPYDVLTDLTPIANIALGPNALVVNPSVPAKTVKEFITWAKTQPNGATFSTAGVGTPAHMAAELFKVTTGINMLIVPNKGMSPAILDVMSGNVQALFAGLPAAIPFERSGKLRLIAVAETRRSGLSPETPTVAEAGLPGFDVGNWTGLLGPAGLPRPIVDALNAAMNRFLASAEAKEKFAGMGFDAIGGTPAAFGERIRHDVARWTDLVKRAGIPRN
ncbi:MAG: Bug family tripartite tricarboxylate transporter substrate binding protein, partial [Burkholderiales bacterium]